MPLEMDDGKHLPACVWHKNKALGIGSLDCNCGAHSDTGRTPKMEWRPIDQAPIRVEVVVFHPVASHYGGTALVIAWKDEKGVWHDDTADDGVLRGGESISHFLLPTDPEHWECPICKRWKTRA